MLLFTVKRMSEISYRLPPAAVWLRSSWSSAAGIWIWCWCWGRPRSSLACRSRTRERWSRARCSWGAPPCLHSPPRAGRRARLCCCAPRALRSSASLPRRSGRACRESAGLVEQTGPRPSRRARSSCRTPDALRISGLSSGTARLSRSTGSTGAARDARRGALPAASRPTTTSLTRSQPSKAL